MPGRNEANMADAEDNIDTFLRNIPSQIAEARCQMFCNNVNIIEFIQRRLEDSVLLLNILYQRCVDDQLKNDLNTLITELHFWHQRYDDLWMRYGNASSQLRFSCPREESGDRGRPRYRLPENAILDLHRIHRRWRHVAESVGVSYRTLLRRRHEYGLSVAVTRGPRSTYTEITQNNLCDVVREVLQILPNAGETFVLGALRQREIHVQRWRVREAIRAVDPLSRAMRRSVAVLRRVYNVPCPNALW